VWFAELREPGQLRACAMLIKLAATIRRRIPKDDADPLVDARDVLMEVAQELMGKSPLRIFSMTTRLPSAITIRRWTAS